MVNKKNIKDAGKNDHQKKILKKRIDKINAVIGKFEGEVEKALDKFMKKGERSSQILKKNFEDMVERISSSEIYSRASEKTEEITNEVRRVADDVVRKFKSFDLSAAKSVLGEARENIDQLVEKLQAAEFVEIAKDKAVNTRRQVLHVLNIPSQEEVTRLTRKVTSLEKKINTISSKQAAPKQAA